jgi:hypothetical protein
MATKENKMTKRNEKKTNTQAQAPVPMKTVKNLMSGKEIQIPANTPLCCDPSSETYWSM